MTKTVRSDALNAGIYVGDGMVIHLMGPNKLLNRPDPCQKCGFQTTTAGIYKTCMDCFLEGHSLYRCDYSVPSNLKMAWKIRRGLCSTSDSKPSDEVVQTAHRLLQEKDFGTGEYHFLMNNCEDFAVYCKTGVARSNQTAGLMGNPLYTTVKRKVNKLRKKPNANSDVVDENKQTTEEPNSDVDDQ
ncbi:hypothetical protein COLO4_15398 [Corchorus olitorius]|uniref:LRAT domain-containing protein n=1 Tax=Corchorus olitorius TaxID=93759 RepID=A0A1R3JN16_9ROSI|nr:hypothetical protein COLO4_15398 [Corchorus olitorius]